MSGEVTQLGTVTCLDIPAERVLDAAKGTCTNGVIVIGLDADGEEYFASSIADGGEVLWLVERFKAHLLAEADQ